MQLFVAFNKWPSVEIEVKDQLDQFITYLSIKIQKKKSFLNTFFFSHKKGAKNNCQQARLLANFISRYFVNLQIAEMASD